MVFFLFFLFLLLRVRRWSFSSAVYSWGRGEDGQLGLGDTNDQYQPVLVEALKEYKLLQIACGSGHTVVLTGPFYVAWPAGRCANNFVGRRCHHTTDDLL